jgi:hypothetical protein
MDTSTLEKFGLELSTYIKVTPKPSNGMLSLLVDYLVEYGDIAIKRISLPFGFVALA